MNIVKLYITNSKVKKILAHRTYLIVIYWYINKPLLNLFQLKDRTFAILTIVCVRSCRHHRKDGSSFLQDNEDPLSCHYLNV